MIVTISATVILGWAFTVITGNPQWMAYAVVSAIAVLV